MKNGFVKVAAVTPPLHLADTAANTDELIRLSKAAAKQGVALAVFPELCITGATCGDLFFSESLIKSAMSELNRFLKATEKTDIVAVVGLPIAPSGNRLYNCAAICHQGSLLGLVPKTQLTQEERRYFIAPPRGIYSGEGILGECEISANMVFHMDGCSSFTFSVEIGSEADALLPPSVCHTAAGANIICNPSAIPETVSSSERRRSLTQAQSARLQSAHIVASAGTGESTSDRVYGGYSLICENRRILAERPAFSQEELLITEIDVDLLASEHRKSQNGNAANTQEYLHIYFSQKESETKLTRHVNPHPFIPEDPSERALRCERILDIQAHGLKERMRRAYVKKAVIGISGGLDSTLALLVAVRAMDLLNRPHSDVLAITMPGFGTTSRTKNNATLLCRELGVEFRCVGIAASVSQHFTDIGHDPNVRNVTYENCQARERTQVLMDIANDCGGMVIGTGDLSELALGWATYNGDHMSMYGVNASVPKTLIRHIVAHSASTYEQNGKTELAFALRDILDTPVSPELLPAEKNGEIAQKTEDLVGPYELHDFYIYHLLRYGFSPEKLYRLAKHALGSTYSDETLIKWLEILLRRFFAQQFKRSCLPDGPGVGSVSLSPRGAWQMPSDALSVTWQRELDRLKAQMNIK